MTKANMRAAKKAAQDTPVNDTVVMDDDRKAVKPKVKPVVTKSAASSTPQPSSDLEPDSGTAKQSDTTQKTTTRPVGGCLTEGPAEMYLYWNWKEGMWMGPKENFFAALQAGNGFIKVKMVWIKDGKFHHFLSDQEIEKYCP